jgi:hypothetical protein
VLLSYAASVVMSFTYGKTTPTSYTDPEIVTVNKCIGRFGRAIRPGAYLVDTYPILRFVPGYLNQLKVWHQEEHALFKGQLDAVRRQMVRDSIVLTNVFPHHCEARGNYKAILCEVHYRAPETVPARR